MIFNGGLPYGPELEKLDAAFVELPEGRVISHSELAEAIGAPARSPRFYGVINAWIKQQKNKNRIFMAWRPKRGVEVLAPAALLDHAEDTMRSKVRQTARAVRTFSYVDRARLDTAGQQRLDHQLRITAVLGMALDTARKELAVPLAPIKSLPRPEVPNAKA